MEYNSSTIEAVQEKAGLMPDSRAYTFLGHNGIESAVLRYSELEISARAIAATIQQTGLTHYHQTDNQRPRALLMYPSGLDFIEAFYGCLFSGYIAVPVSPPDPLRIERTLPRFLSVLENCGATVILTTTKKYADISCLLNEELEQAKSGFQKKQLSIFREAVNNRKIHWLKTDSVDQSHATLWQPPVMKNDDLAFLQYTSGSTANPKGVMISHANILHNLEIIHSAAMQDKNSCFVSWLPNYHDMGLIGSILYPMYVGFHSVQMSSISFLKRPVSWLKALSKYQGTITAAPNFAYELCISRVPEEKRKGLDLSSVNLALSGSEPVRINTLKKFFETYAAYGLRWESLLPSYGLAEATCAVSGKQKLTPLVIKSFDKKALEKNIVIEVENDDVLESKNIWQLVSCGAPLDTLKVIIVNPDNMKKCTSNEIGEIWIEGNCVGAGYWNNQKETDKTFNARLKNDDGSCYLRTGDLGFICNGDLFITGRLKDLIVINGYNHYPQDIEKSVEESHPKIRASGTAAFTIDSENETKLIVVSEIEKGASDLTDEIKQAITNSLSVEHSLTVQQIVFIQAGSINKTTSGKIQRHACKNSFLENMLKTITEH